VVTGATSEIGRPVAPGYVPKELPSFESLGQVKSSAGPKTDQLPLRAIAHMADSVEAYVFLASSTCSRTATGTVLQLDGGASLHGPRL